MIFTEGPLINEHDILLTEDGGLSETSNNTNMLSIPDEGISLEDVEKGLLEESLRK